MKNLNIYTVLTGCLFMLLVPLASVAQYVEDHQASNIASLSSLRQARTIGKGTITPAQQKAMAMHSKGFVENKGQIKDQFNNLNPDVKYLLAGEGLNVQLRANGFSYDTYIEKSNKTNGDQSDRTKTDDITRHYHRVDIDFIGSNPNPLMVTEAPGPDYLMYYLEGQEVPTEVHHYGKVIYKNLYPGIDLEFVTNPNDGKPVEYNFIVHPGADPNQIQWKYDGATCAALKDGKIVLDLVQGQLAERIPSSYYKENSKNEVAVTYQQKGRGFAFDVPENYDNQQTLVIDPTPDLLWGTYYGGTGADVSFSVFVDGFGNIYLAGRSASTTNIATVGAHQSTSGGSTDAFLAKFDASGVRQWATYYGGSGADEANGVAVDVAGDIYITGSTVSISGIATAGAHKTTFTATGGQAHVFIAKFNASGVRQWGTYYGGNTGDTGYSIAVDASSNVYVAGLTASNSGISTAGAHQTAYGGGGSTDAFLVKFNSAGVRQWGTYYGDNQPDYATSVAVDGAGNAYITGFTSSTSAIATAGAHQTTGLGAFLAKFNTAGVRQWGTYYGSGCVGYSVAVDGSGNPYLAGSTTSTGTDIATAGSHQDTNGGVNDAFLVRFDPSGVRQWGTYYGGSASDIGYAVSVSGSDIYLAGTASSTSGIATTGAYQTTQAGSSDGFLAKFNISGVLEWGTYYGGTGADVLRSVAADGSGDIYVSGSSSSAAAIATTGTHQATYGGGGDAVLAKFGSTPENCTNGIDDDGDGLVDCLDPDCGIPSPSSGVFQFQIPSGNLFVPRQLLKLKNGNIAVLGLSYLNSLASPSQQYLQIVDANFNIISQLAIPYGANGTSSNISVVSEMNDGSLVISGHDHSGALGVRPLIKLNPDYTLDWKRIVDDYSIGVNPIIISDDNHIILMNSSTSLKELNVLKIDLNGNIISNKKHSYTTMGSVLFGVPLQIKKLGNGDLLVVMRLSTSSGPFSTALFRLSLDGSNFIWGKELLVPGNVQDGWMDFVEGNNGNIYGFSSRVTPTSINDLWKLDANGNLLEFKSVDFNINNEFLTFETEINVSGDGFIGTTNSSGRAVEIIFEPAISIKWAKGFPYTIYGPGVMIGGNYMVPDVLVSGNTYKIYSIGENGVLGNCVVTPFSPSLTSPVPFLQTITATTGSAALTLSTPTGYSPVVVNLSPVRQIPACGSPANVEICTNTLDDDADGLIDSADPDCACFPYENCTNGIDDDGDGLVDCDDPDCGNPTLYQASDFTTGDWQYVSNASDCSPSATTSATGGTSINLTHTLNCVGTTNTSYQNSATDISPLNNGKPTGSPYSLDITGDYAYLNSSVVGALAFRIGIYQGVNRAIKPIPTLFTPSATFNNFSVSFTQAELEAANIDITSSIPIRALVVIVNTANAVGVTRTGAFDNLNYVWTLSCDASCDKIPNVAFIQSVDEVDPVTNNNRGNADLKLGSCTCDLNPIAYTVTCNNNGTPANPADDTYMVTDFIVTAAAGGGVGGYNLTGGITATGNAYGTAYSYGPFPISGGPLSVTAMDVNTVTCTRTDQIIPPAACSNCTVTGTATGDVACVGESVQLTASGGDAYSWTGPNGFSSVEQNPVINGATAVMAGTYTVVITNTAGGGCTDTETVTVTVNPLPVVSAGADQLICEESSATLVATGCSGTLLWSTGESSTGISVNPASDAVYSVSCTVSGCVGTDEVVVRLGSISLTATPSACLPATSTHDVSGSLIFNTPPATGTLTVSVSGQQQVFSAPFISPLSYTLSGIPSTGGTLVVSAIFSDSPMCEAAMSYTSPAACSECVISGINVSPGPCNPLTDLYTITGSLTFTDAPSTGTLTITGNGGGQTVIDAPFTSPVNFSFPGLVSDGLAHQVLALFSDRPQCLGGASYTAPGGCTLRSAPNCAFNVTAVAGACDFVNNQYVVDGVLTFTNPPTGGRLVVFIAGGGQQEFYPPFVSPLNYSIPGLGSDGAQHTVVAQFTEDIACSASVVYTAPAGCLRDYGDLIDVSSATGSGDYQTLDVNNGPCHTIVSGLKIGNTVDAETDGQQSLLADGDGTDEDGISTFPNFGAGQSATVSVRVINMMTPASAATLYGFIDWNGDGDFLDTGESATVAVPDGTNGNVVLTFNVPANISTGINLGVRFRLSTQSGLTALGCAADGEIEDYLIFLCTTGKCGGTTVVKN